MLMIADNIFLVFGNGYNCNSYLIKSENGECLLIDSGLGKYDKTWGSRATDTITELNYLLNTYNISKVVLTHAHLDHIGGVASIEAEKRNKVIVHAHKEEKMFLEKPDLGYIDPLLHTPVKPVIIDKAFSSNEKFTFGDFSFTIIHTPGHTEGSLCLYEPEKKFLFSGDCVFPEGAFGRVDFPGSNAIKMISSLEYLSSLEVKSLFAGHMNPILTGADISIKQSYINAKSFLSED